MVDNADHVARVGVGPFVEPVEIIGIRYEEFGRDDRIALELLWTARGFAEQRMPLANEEIGFQLPDFDCVDAFVATEQLAWAHQYVEVSPLEKAERAFRGERGEMQAEIGMTLYQPGEGLAQKRLNRGRTYADPQLASLALSLPFGIENQKIELGDDPLGAVDEIPALDGRYHAACAAFEQGMAKLLLDRRDALRERRLGNEGDLGSRRKRARALDRDHMAQACEIDRHTFLLGIAYQINEFERKGGIPHTPTLTRRTTATGFSPANDGANGGESLMVAKTFLLGSALTVIALATPAAAQEVASASQEDGRESGGLADIVVTAQKREQSLQDVPVSVSVIGGGQLAEQATPKFEDLNAAIPNFSVSRNAIQDSVTIRGINSDGQAGSEQSVGIYVDGIFRGRGQQSRFSFLDIERLEVLRGPQGTLFGKNTIAGALNITSARPTKDLSLGLAASYEFNQNEADLAGHVSGPISDRVRGRVAFSWRNMDKGWIRNIGYDEDMPKSEEWAVRASLEAELTDSITLYTKYEHGEFRERGAPYDFVKIGPSLAAAVARLGLPEVKAGYDGVTNISNADPVLPIPYLAAIDPGSAFAVDGSNDEIAVQLDAEVGPGKLTFLYGFSRYDFDRMQDLDFGPLPVASFADPQDYKQHSAELRYASDTGGTLEYIVGGYFQSADLLARGETTYNFRAISALQGGVAILNPPTSNPTRIHELDQKATSWALFGQATLNLSEQFRVTAGLRYSHEKKKAVQFAEILDATTRAPATPPPSPPFPPALLSWYLLPTETVIHRYNLRRSESQISPQIQVQYDVTDDIMLFASYGRGNKGGGFNSFALGLNPLDPADDTGSEYEDERADSFEVGTKMTLADGRARLNISYFNMRFKNLQTASFTGSTGFIVTNAAAAKVQGIEVDGMWAVTDDITLSANAGWIDFKFTDYRTAGCTSDQILGGGYANAAACSAAGGNDLSGRPNQDTPEFTASFNARYAPDSSWLRNLFFDASYSGSYFATSDLDPATVQDAFWKLNAGISVGPRDGPWQVSLIARNLTNEHTFSFANDVPLFPGSHLVAWQRPRSFTARLKLDF